MNRADDRSTREGGAERPPQEPAREPVPAPPAQDLARQHQDQEDLGMGRREVHGADSSRDEPHVPAQDARADIQDELPSPAGVPVSPANAGGTDKVGSQEQREPIDETSMYDRRPERDKDRPPSERAR